MLNVLDETLKVPIRRHVWPEGGARETADVDFRAKSRIMLDSTGIVLTPVGEDGAFFRATWSRQPSRGVDLWPDLGITRQALSMTISMPLAISPAGSNRLCHVRSADLGGTCCWPTTSKA